MTNFIKVTYFPKGIFLLVNIHVESLPPLLFSSPRSGRTTSRSLHQNVPFLRHCRVSQGLFWETQLYVAFLAKAHLTLARGPFSELTPSPAMKASFFGKMLVGTSPREEPSQEEGSQRQRQRQGRGGRGPPRHPTPQPSFSLPSLEMKLCCQA